MSRPNTKATTTRAWVYNDRYANAAYSASTDNPPSSASASSMAAKAVTAWRCSGLAASEPMPIANTMTAKTIDACVAVLPIRYEPSDTSANSYTSPHAAQTNTTASNPTRANRDRGAVCSASSVTVWQRR
ncbi:Uncharacterised protein [Mycobacteroides abscessus subsp. abscessus]|nr:Uncharacterised protein [Mycobacteroides abscessus subsp. abscessus]